MLDFFSDWHKAKRIIDQKKSRANRQTNGYESKGSRKIVHIPVNAAEMKEAEIEIIK